MELPIFLALDFPTWEETNQFINKNELQGVPVKVGMELFYREGPKVIERLKENNHAIFLDLKLHDIPTTVKKAMRNIAQFGVDVTNIHAFGGSEMIAAAKEGLEQGAQNGITPKLLAVTLLTSMDEHTLQHEIKMNDTIDNTVVRFAKLTKESGGDGVVCSAYEAAAIKQSCGSDFLTVTPGIRLANTNKDDQKRVATPSFAKNNGADMLVIGRSITQAEYPNKMYQQAIEEWKTVVKS
ncbi:orotidine-5'-phosphate decarboxylase [Aquibacillus rhizosphaerae]|uniref:Orotidine 5'-phosphate decarboxylase n=1 Tax=Aquibacillus rhizosphaerae TaxID=3051431 RepID=A0ABT7L2B3_9BACI|nr:orotidine-5'-phosphate decarboxylase [Aquibacillus sp. LR5S19]MDL4840001.1 orotidine-5'-phosphate decarboxylase [Aquibacillus sp. LR5S19]